MLEVEPTVQRDRTNTGSCRNGLGISFRFRRGDTIFGSAAAAAAVCSVRPTECVCVCVCALINDQRTKHDILYYAAVWASHGDDARLIATYLPFSHATVVIARLYQTARAVSWDGKNVRTRSCASADGPRDALSVKILSTVETSSTTKSGRNRSNRLVVSSHYSSTGVYM